MGFWRNTQIKHARKEHRCIFCLRIIQKGESAEYSAGMFEGEFQSFYFCTRCEKFVEKYNINLSDSFGEGDFMEYAHSIDLARCPSCGSYNHREDEWTDKSMMSCKYQCDDCEHTWTADYSMKDVAP